MAIVSDGEGHQPVMVEEVMAALSPEPDNFHIDATVGGGGHTHRVLEATSPGGRLLGIDADQAAIARSRRSLAEFGDRVVLRQANFENLGEVAREEGFEDVHGVLFDLGLSSDQLADHDRSFSFRSDGALDMRFDTSRGVPASELVATLDEAQLADLFWRYGEERYARRIARAIVARRAQASIDSGAQLAAVVTGAVPTPSGRSRIHPATRVFQALRIAVNRELAVLPIALRAAVEVLRPDGRLCVISYHSLEDRIVKRFVAAERRGCTCPPQVPVCVCGRAARLANVGPAPQRPSEPEVARNARARSARLRACRRLAA